MKSVNASTAKAQLLAILDDVHRTGRPVRITKRGKAIARIVPDADEPLVTPQSRITGKGRIVGDVVGPVLPPEVWDAVRGDWEPHHKKRRR
jgi:prevent-host-death family protein